MPSVTARSIARSFSLSGKRHLLLTGPRGSGKSTLLAQLRTLLSPFPLPGLTTWVQPGQAVRMKDETTGCTAVVGRYDPSLPGPGNQMQPQPPGFQSVGCPALKTAPQLSGGWFYIDEIGYLDGSCPEYCREILAYMERGSLLAALRSQDLPFLNQLRTRDDVYLVDLDASLPQMGCVIMASGLSSRFGGNKLMAQFRGSPMLSHVLDASDGLFARRVVVTRNLEVAQFCRSRGVETVFHHLPHRSDTVRLGLEALETDVCGCMFCPGDQPLIQRDTLITMLLCAGRDSDMIWQPAFGENPGTPVLFPKWAFDQLKTLPEGKGGRILCKKYPERVRLVPVRDPYELYDADTPEDLLRLSAHRKQ